jgi:hypothetical protein
MATKEKKKKFLVWRWINKQQVTDVYRHLYMIMCLCACYLPCRLIHRVPHGYGIVTSCVSSICITSYSAFKLNLKIVSSNFSWFPCTVETLQCSHYSPACNTKLKARCTVNSRLATVTFDTRTWLLAEQVGVFSALNLILRRSRTGTAWFCTSTSNKRAARPKLYTKSLTRDLKPMYSRLTLVRISINL